MCPAIGVTHSNELSEEDDEGAAGKLVDELDGAAWMSTSTLLFCDLSLGVRRHSGGDGPYPRVGGRGLNGGISGRCLDAHVDLVVLQITVNCVQGDGQRRPYLRV